MTTLRYTQGQPLCSVLTACLINTRNKGLINLAPCNMDNIIIEENDIKINIRDMDAARHLARKYYPLLKGATVIDILKIDSWLDYLDKDIKQDSILKTVESHLQLRTFIVGSSITLADLALYTCLSKSSISKSGPHVDRWLNYLNQLPFINFAKKEYFIERKKENDGEANFGVLDGAEMGKVVTRFPPEPSGYLHIGHAKAALLNNHFARQYKGKLILRFDDTNPCKEKEEYTQSIIKDLDKMGVKPDVTTHTSDYFNRLEDLCEKMISAGKFYVDKTPVAQMRDERLNMQENKYRSQPVDENLRLWKEMKKGSEEGQLGAVRARIDMKSKNGAMRDPFMYRCIVDTPHARTGTKYKAYPGYDFACPAVDSWEGVTHALRSLEYRDRLDLYNWVLNECDLKPVAMYEFSRLNFKNTVLSKRKLKWFVENNHVDGWDDPRFPTCQGLLRKGLNKQALWEFILDIGPSKSASMMEWDKLWSKNKQVIDPTAPRCTAVGREEAVRFTLTDGEDKTENHPLHPKNADLGSKAVRYSKKILIEQDDAKLCKEGEEVTLMRLGNVIIDKIEKNDDCVKSITGHLNPTGLPKNTSKKLHWVVDNPDHLQTVKILLREFDHLITKEKPEEDDEISDLVNMNSCLETTAIGEEHMKNLKIGDVIQLERRGYFIVDKPNVLHMIPDGKTKNMSTVTGKVDKKTLTKGGNI
eukprot:GHVL01025327.1.p1 GENE.GHVL01025327.1~~GHVL01025327.1.p1  ORF type:complete len:700 (+),score=134.84 GHVL01025327.1:66-2165(+)